MLRGMEDRFRIAFVSGKLGDVDGVSLEVDKWVEVLSSMGHEVFTVAGKYARPVAGVPAERQYLLDRIRFDSPQQQHYERLAFPHLNRRPPHLNQDSLEMMMDQLESDGKEVADILREYIQDNEIDVLVAENTNAMPMSLVGGMAMYRLATENRMATIFHHHDFWWERSRFSNNNIERLLNRIMPPVDPGLEHVVISSYASHILSSLKRVRPHIIPNCEDFEHPVTLDDYNRTFREDMGFGPDDVLVVQPTRIVPRKRIEDSVALLGRFVERYPAFRDRIRYIVSLYQGDESEERYIDEIRAAAARAGIPLHLIADRVASSRGTDEQGQKIYTNRDVLANADLVTYLPIWEGFGNALLEAVAARVPVVTTTYLVYKTDIMTSGLYNVEIRDRYDDRGDIIIPEDALDEIHYLLTHPEERRERVEHNFERGRAEFSLPRLADRLSHVLTEYADEIRASRRRLRKTRMRYSV
ncbi:MAG: glycosyl transferase family 1 [Spirochaetaceae bacterium]